MFWSLLVGCSSTLVPVEVTPAIPEDPVVTASEFHLLYWDRLCGEAAKCDDPDAIELCDRAPAWDPDSCTDYDAGLAEVCLGEMPTCGGDTLQFDATCMPSRVCGNPTVQPLTCREPEGSEPNEGAVEGLWVDDGYQARLSLRDDDVDTFVFDVPPHTWIRFDAWFDADDGNVQLKMKIAGVEMGQASGEQGFESVVFQNVGDGWMPVSVDAHLQGDRGCVLYDVDVAIRPI